MKYKRSFKFIYKLTNMLNRFFVFFCMEYNAEMLHGS